MKSTDIKMIICDLDGTLVDSMGNFGVVAQGVLGEFFGMEAAEALAAYQRTSGLPFRFQVESLFPKDTRNEAAAVTFEERKKAGYAAKPFFPDVLQMVPKLVALGYKFCVSSNNDQTNVTEKMAPLSIYFSEILGFRPGFLKGKSHFDHVIETYGYAPNEMLFIGDSLHDAKMAYENGVSFVARQGTFSREAFLALNLPLVTTVTDFNRLFDLLEGNSIEARRLGSR